MNKRLVIGFTIAFFAVLTLALISTSLYHPPKDEPIIRVISGELTPDFSTHGVYLNMQFSKIPTVKGAYLDINGTKYYNTSPVKLLDSQGKVILCTTFKATLKNDTYYVVNLVFQNGGEESYSVKYINIYSSPLLPQTRESPQPSRVFP
ncbi:hypothetical protein [Sulfuracidifex tepidarius]|uniref:SbsA Ig-like domain-containing protein n=1 Tax=Sulfuracidifex tepidarius TaxID=1294262 RepID=A0A510DTA6_9CREN|nr:hypothetical protein [Sulfuracidifex tepidarius]BBG23422.1 hypothetical protein IC006_0706 [Sulfuracidifex tepidarius]BBG26174.1 hypothetical protein IC007_0679 [Sulfuracidifex tepidarius]